MKKKTKSDNKSAKQSVNSTENNHDYYYFKNVSVPKTIYLVNKILQAQWFIRGSRLRASVCHINEELALKQNLKGNCKIQGQNSIRELHYPAYQENRKAFIGLISLQIIFQASTLYFGKDKISHNTLDT